MDDKKSVNSDNLVINKIYICKDLDYVSAISNLIKYVGKTNDSDWGTQYGFQYIPAGEFLWEADECELKHIYKASEAEINKIMAKNL